MEVFSKDPLETPINTLPNIPTDIQNFYCGKNVFVTGATGFLGKILIEKLLWSCPNIGNIYVLMREKKGKDTAQRLNDLLETAIFSRVAKVRPNFKEKVKVIIGDCERVGLGFLVQDREELIREVNVVFHVAATVRFNEPLNVALNTNLRASQDMIELAKEMKALASYIHVSTAYVHCYLSELDEHFYETPVDPLKLLKFIETADQKIIDGITPKLVENWPNTYSFSKAMTEDYLRQYGGVLPLGIVRPSIVASSNLEPIKNYGDNWYGLNGYITACGAGLLRAIKAIPEGEANIVPVDMCINAMIASAWDVAECYKQVDRQAVPTSRNIRIYNYVLTDNPIRWGEFYNMAVEGGQKTPPLQAIWYRCLLITQYTLMHNMNKLFLHWLPAIIMDLAAVCTGNKAQLIKGYRRIHSMEEATIYFTMRSWKFTNNNVTKLIAKMTPDDRQLYSLDTNTIVWKDYMELYFLGIRRYLLKEKDSTVPAALRKYRKLYWLHRALKFVTYVCFLRGAYGIGLYLHNNVINYQAIAAKLGLGQYLNSKTYSVTKLIYKAIIVWE